MANIANIYKRIRAAIYLGKHIIIPSGKTFTMKNRSGTTLFTVDSSGNVVATSLTMTGAIQSGAQVSTAAILSSSASGGMGYTTGAGGAVTQITSRTTGVTLSKVCGSITTDTSSLAAEAAAEFTVTNTIVLVTDVVVASIQSGSNGGNTDVIVTTVANGSFKLKVCNNNAAAGTAETGAIIINFAIIRGVAA